MDNKVSAEQNGNRKFVVPEEFMEDDLYLVLMVILTEGSQAKKCKGIGLTKLEPVCNTSELKLDITPNKDSTVSTMDLITKCLKEKEHDKHMFQFTFQIKVVEESFLNTEDFVFQRASVPTLLQTRVNKIAVTLDMAKIVGKVWTGSSFSVSMEVEIRDREDNTITCIHSHQPDKKVAVYQTLTSPSNLKCEWREMIHIDLTKDQNKWKNLHI